MKLFPGICNTFRSWPSPRRKRLALRAFALGAFVLAVGGCWTIRPADDAARPTLLNPRWQNEAFAEHLDFFAGAFLDSNPPASKPVAEYVSAQLRDAWLQPGVEGRYRLWQAPDRPLGYVGYVGGKRPPFAREAVLVCADLSSGEAPATEAAALLEVARVYGIASQYTLAPERSVIFALWPHVASTEDDPLAGLRTYLRQPTWHLDAVRAVIYVGLPARLRADAEALLAERGIALYRVSVSPTEEAAEAAGKDAAEPVRAAVLRARALAQRTHQRLRATTLTSGKIMPALGDTLRVPSEQQP